MFDFGMRIRELRLNRRMSQEDLGRRVGRSKSVISTYENNLKIPPLDIIVQFASIFNVSLDYLVGLDKNEMVSLDGLTDNQKSIIKLILSDFKNPGIKTSGLSSQEQEIVGALVNEFSKRK